MVRLIKEVESFMVICHADIITLHGEVIVQHCFGIVSIATVCSAVFLCVGWHRAIVSVAVVIDGDVWEVGFSNHIHLKFLIFSRRDIISGVRGLAIWVCADGFLCKIS